MFTTWHAGAAFACAMVLAAALSVTVSAAGCRSAPLLEGPAGPVAVMPGGSVAQPPAAHATLTLAQQRRMGVWLWSVDTQDWMAEGSGSSFWVHRIIRLAEQEGGALRHPIVLMHYEPTGNRRLSAHCRRSSGSSAHTATASSRSSHLRATSSLHAAAAAPPADRLR
jgi:hypothetical protein